MEDFEALSEQARRDIADLRRFIRRMRILAAIFIVVGVPLTIFDLVTHHG